MNKQERVEALRVSREALLNTRDLYQTNVEQMKKGLAKLYDSVMVAMLIDLRGAFPGFEVACSAHNIPEFALSDDYLPCPVCGAAV